MAFNCLDIVCLKMKNLNQDMLKRLELLYSLIQGQVCYFLYLYGDGKNFRMNNNFYSLYLRKNFKKLIATSQLYILFTNLQPDSTYGITQKISYQLKDKISLNFFVNKSLTNEIFNRTFGIQFNF